MTLSTAITSASVEPEIFVEMRAPAWGEVEPDPTELCRRAAGAALASFREASGGAEISIVLADDAFVHGLNRTWRNVDAPTNVLAFPCSDEGDGAAPGAEWLLGDVVIAFQTTRREAAELGLPLAHHVAHLVIHGVLHLLGYDHVEDGDAAIMEKLEIDALERLGIGNPYEEDAGNT